MLPALHIKSYTGESLLIDAGEGTQTQLLKAGISPNRIDAILITHLHGDHIFGLPGLIQHMSLTGRLKPLLILGPGGLDDFLLQTFRTTRFSPRFDLKYLQVKGYGTIRLGRLSVSWFPVCHNIEAYGYKVEHYKRPNLSKEKLSSKGLLGSPLTKTLLEKGKVEIGGTTVYLDEVVEKPARRYCLVYTGDTAPCMSVIEESKGCNLLFHDSTFGKDHRYEALEYGHSTSYDAASIAAAAGVDRLVLIHISPRYKDNPKVLQEEAREVFPRVYLGEELSTYTIIL